MSASSAPLILCLSLILLASSAGGEDLNPGMVEAFLNNYEYADSAVLVCPYKYRNVVPAASTREKPQAQTSATIVKNYKGAGAIGEQLHYYELYEPSQNEPITKTLGRMQEKSLGKLRFLFLSGDEATTSACFMLSLGDGWRYDPALERLLLKRKNSR